MRAGVAGEGYHLHEQGTPAAAGCRPGTVSASQARPTACNGNIMRGQLSTLRQEDLEQMCIAYVSGSI